MRRMQAVIVAGAIISSVGPALSTPAARPAVDLTNRWSGHVSLAIDTFFAHLKWSWAIGLGYAASIWLHFLVNASAFE